MARWMAGLRRRAWVTTVLTALGVLALAAMLRLPASAERTAQAPIRQPTTPGAAIPAPPPQLGQLGLSHACAPAEVITTKTLVQVQCRTAVQLKGLEEVNVFAVGVEDTAFASRVLRVAMSAQIAGYRLKITFASSDVSGERVGCSPKNCRLIQTIGLLVN